MKPLERKTANAAHQVRPYRTEDRSAIRELCCDTGFLGNPIDEIFSDHETFADYLTSYYTDWEPESTWVGLVDGQVVGYLTACGNWRRNRFWSAWIAVKLAPRVFLQWLSGRYDARDRRFLSWILLRGWKETPVTPKKSAHFHFNARKEFRTKLIMRDLIVTMLEEFQKRGIPRIHGQMVTYGRRRSDRLFEYMGWKVIDRKRVTKYDHLLDEEIHLTTIVKELN